MINFLQVAPWSVYDSSNSMKEGWSVFNSDTGKARIERDDEAGIFKGDDDVWEFVAKQAANGSDRHRRALLHVAVFNPGEFRQIMKHLETL